MQTVLRRFKNTQMIVLTSSPRAPQIAAECQARAEAAFEEARTWTNERIAFGKPLFDKQVRCGTLKFYRIQHDLKRHCHWHPSSGPSSSESKKAAPFAHGPFTHTSQFTQRSQGIAVVRMSNLHVLPTRRSCGINWPR